MIRAFRSALFALLLFGSPAIVLAACETFKDPASYAGVLPGEANAVRVIAASHLIEGATKTVSTQLSRGIITPAEAQSAKDSLQRAQDLLKTAAEAVRLGNASASDQLAAVNAIIIGILREQAVKGA